MNQTNSIHINARECVKCWRCIRECPVKAIAAGADSATIDPMKCTSCGQCLSMCRFGAVKLRDDIYTVRDIIKRNSVKVASVTPQWITEMEGMSEGALVEAFRLLGFTHVSETALGAEKTLQAEIPGDRNTVISSRCPAIVSYVAKYAPRHTSSLSECEDPPQVHARMVRHWWGKDARIVHFTACPAAKNEAAAEGSGIDAVLTFRELKKWLRDEGIDTANLFGGEDFRFEPVTAKRGLLYNLCGDAGNIPGSGTHTYHSSPLHEAGEVLKSFGGKYDGPLWLDMMACRGGCTGSGASSVRNVSPVLQAEQLRNKALGRSHIADDYNLPYINTARTGGLPTPPDGFVAESDTLLALDELGMTTRAMQTDCNACGFGTCRRFAKALSRGEVVREMCWFYLRSEVATKFTTLLSKLSSGVAIVNSSMRIEQTNRLFATMMGSSAEALFDSGQALAGTAAADVMPFYGLVSSVIESGEESVVRDVQIGERLITVSVHTVQKNRTVLVICRNMMFSQVRNEEIVKRTQRVINENLETVRRIASLLGENASRTEAILNSILEAHTRENES